MWRYVVLRNHLNFIIFQIPVTLSLPDVRGTHFGKFGKRVKKKCNLYVWGRVRKLFFESFLLRSEIFQEN